MTARSPAATTTTPAQRLATDVRAALDLLRRGQREAAEATKRPPENVPLLVALDDLAVTVGDLDLLARDLEGNTR